MLLYRMGAFSSTPCRLEAAGFVERAVRRLEKHCCYLGPKRSAKTKVDRATECDCILHHVTDKKADGEKPSERSFVEQP